MVTKQSEKNLVDRMARLAVLARKCQPAAGKVASLKPRVFGEKLAPSQQKPPETGASTSYQPSQLSQSHSADDQNESDDQDEQANVEDKDDMTTKLGGLRVD